MKNEMAKGREIFFNQIYKNIILLKSFFPALIFDAVRFNYDKPFSQKEFIDLIAIVIL